MSARILNFLTLVCLWVSTGAASAHTYVVSNTHDAGDGSLRAAINHANYHLNEPATEPDRIHFKIPGAGVHRIAPLTALPDVTDPVIIDGYSQAGTSANTAAYSDNAILLIELNGAKCRLGNIPPGVAQKGLTLKASSTVRGLVLNHWFCYAIMAAGDGQQYLFEGNFIGTDATGSRALGNGSGLVLYADAIVGGTSRASRNVISGNRSPGVDIWGGFAIVQGNFIGPAADGSSRIASRNAGVYFMDFGDGLIGGAEEAAANVISGNDVWGIYVSAHSKPQIVGNRIGTDAKGTKPLGNGAGIEVNLSAEIGTMSDGTATLQVPNRIAFNHGPGIRVGSSRSAQIPAASITGNQIFHNRGLGTDLGGDGTTPNDEGDGDTGANGLQNYPLLTSAAADQGVLTIDGSFNSKPDTNYRLEFFGNAGDARSGRGEGRWFLGTAEVRTRAAGNAVIHASFPFKRTKARSVTATATDPDGHTSEFSQSVQLTQAFTSSAAEPEEGE